MDVRQKAKRYDEAIKMAKEYLMSPRTCFDIEQLYDIFPELRESEDERIRKALITFFEKFPYGSIGDAGTNVKEAIAWLEKQKEPELSKDLSDYIAELSKQFPEVSFAKLSRIAVRVKNWFEKQGEQKPYGQRKECLDCQFNYSGECKGSCTMKRSEQKPQRMISAEAKETLYDKPTDIMDKDNIDDFAYQCAYDLSKDWLYENASWDDVQIACKLGAKWYEDHHKVHWSEEDETNLTNTIIMLKEGASHHFTNFSIIPCVDWLKQLKQRIGG